MGVTEGKRRLVFTTADLVLLALLSGEKKLSDLTVPGKGDLSSVTVYRKLDKLRDYGFVEERRGERGRRFLRLTEKGRRIAVTLKVLEEELEQ